jgi:hypothetical protein
MEIEGLDARGLLFGVIGIVVGMVTIGQVTGIYSNLVNSSTLLILGALVLYPGYPALLAYVGYRIGKKSQDYL